MKPAYLVLVCLLSIPVVNDVHNQQSPQTKIFLSQFKAWRYGGKLIYDKTMKTNENYHETAPSDGYILL